MGLVVAGALASSVAAELLIAGVTVSGQPDQLEVSVAAGGPLDYALAETADPFTLTFLFGDASFTFPESRRAFPGPGLAELRTTTVTREGRRLARLDLTFTGDVAYTVTKDGSTVRLRAQVQGPTEAVTFGSTVVPPVGAPPPSGTTQASTPPHPPSERAAVTEPTAPSPRESGAPPVSPGDNAPQAPAGSAPAQANPAPVPVALVQQLTPESDQRRGRLEVTVDGHPTVRTSTMTGPDRLVIDLDGARYPAGERIIPVGRGLLQRVRVSQYSKTVVRIVCDLARRAPFRVQEGEGRITIALGESVR